MGAINLQMIFFSLFRHLYEILSLLQLFHKNFIQNKIQFVLKRILQLYQPLESRNILLFIIKTKDIAQEFGSRKIRIN